MFNNFSSDKAKDIYQRTKAFMAEYVEPAIDAYDEYFETHSDFSQPPLIEELKAKAKAAGLWNLFLPESSHGAGLTNLEYAPIAELLGQVEFASEVFNCSAPDTGNMEVLDRYGSDAQKARWLTPLLEGKTRSAFAMTEPGVASSDATNIATTIVADGDDYIVNGHKWWISGALHPNLDLFIVMGVTYGEGEAKPHQRHTMAIVPADAEGVEIVRPLKVFGDVHQSAGAHVEMKFNNVRIPAENIILGPGRGFEIAQGRLGPGRIHHCMRLIGMAELALRLMIERGKSRVAFGKPLVDFDNNRDVIAQCRIDIDQARLLTYQAAYMMDTVGNKEAREVIAQIKVVATTMAQKVVDAAIQMHGGAGVSNDTPLAKVYGNVRSLRLADGPDAVHLRTIAKLELAKYR